MMIIFWCHEYLNGQNRWLKVDYPFLGTTIESEFSVFMYNQIYGQVFYYKSDE